MPTKKRSDESKTSTELFEDYEKAMGRLAAHTEDEVDLLKKFLSARSKKGVTLVVQMTCLMYAARRGSLELPFDNPLRVKLDEFFKNLF